jgi:hypothetical protein
VLSRRPEAFPFLPSQTVIGSMRRKTESERALSLIQIGNAAFSADQRYRLDLGVHDLAGGEAEVMR